MDLYVNIIGLIALLSALWVIIDVLTMNDKMKTFNKIIWIVFALMFSIITAIVYYFVEKR